MLAVPALLCALLIESPPAPTPNPPVAQSRGWGLSLRSLYGRDDAPDASDVSRIAKLYGGGGHRAAAGMRADVENIEDMFVPE
jgi:hypothetical protein